MKVRLLSGLLLSGLLCGCAATTPYSETMIDTNKQKQQRFLPENQQVYDRPIFTPGGSSDLNGNPGNSAGGGLSGGH
jgi:hypothetical protein